MIQLANDPNASRSSWRPAAAESKEANPLARAGRSGHPWPFIARQAERPAAQARQVPRTPNGDSGS